MNIKQLAESCGLSETRLKELFPGLTITEDFDVDAFMEKLTAAMDAESGEEVSKEEDMPALPAAVTQQEEGSEIDYAALDAKIAAIMMKEKKEKIDGIGELTFKYREVPKLDLGLTDEELLLLDDNVLDHLSRKGKGVDLRVYKRLQEDGIIKGQAFGDLSKINAYKGDFYPLKEHLQRRAGLYRGKKPAEKQQHQSKRQQFKKSDKKQQPQKQQK